MKYLINLVYENVSLEMNYILLGIALTVLSASLIALVVLAIKLIKE